MNLTREEQAHYRHIQDRLEQWQRHDFEKELLNNVKASLNRVNWHKNILIKKHKEIKIESLISLLNGFEKEIKELENLKTKLRLLNVNTVRCNFILSKTKQLQLLTLKFIEDGHKRTS